MVGAVSEFVLAQYHNTFGNSLVIDGNFMATMVNGGNALAASVSGGTIHAAVTDAGSVVGSFAGQVLTAKPACYLMNGGAAIGSSGGCRVYADTSDIKLYAAVLGT